MKGGKKPMKRKVIAIMLAISALFSMGVPVCAYNGENTVSPYYLYTGSVKSNLTIVNGTAYCESIIMGDRTVTQIYATQYLEKKNGDKWEVVKTCIWSDSVKGKSLTISNSKDNLGSGTYRVRTVGTVYSGSNSEPVEDTSKEVTI